MKNIFIKITFLISLLAMFSCGKEVRETKNPFNDKLLEKYEVYETDNGSFLKDGYYKQWFENGQIKIDCNYEENKLDGEYKSYYNNGQIDVETNYENDSLDGNYLKYYKNGQKKAEGKLIKGKEVGEWKNWHDNNQQSQIYTKNEKGLLDGLLTTWSSNGNKLSEVQYKNGVQEGKAIYYYNNGKKKCEGNYINDKKDINSWKFWTENGDDLSNIKSEIVGTWKDENSKTTYFANGNYSIVWDLGSKSEGKYTFEENKIKRDYNCMMIYGSCTNYDEIIKFEKDKLTVKDQYGKIWNLVKLK